MSQENPGNTDGTENGGGPAEGTPEIPVPPVVPPAVPPVEPPVDGPPVTPPLAPPPAYTAPSAYGPPGAPIAPPPYGYPTAARAPILSILSMVAGIISTIGLWVVFFPLGGIPGLLFPVAALVLGYLGKKREPQTARGFWLAGIIMGYVGVAAAILSIIGWILLFVISGTDSTYN
ncbi:DUF4190 domain-containing protein [Glaciihabitans sp. dw_435]|uniref:DUF4190 domain-containing protein n=1 Tax=Glaciihabitans sp. dw_435 TaxID=2720081 RepID=UPI001BD49F24|nr:DUF4190 domain-containing protein [Glaciihabitans sp. dw_435]